MQIIQEIIKVCFTDSVEEGALDFLLSLGGFREIQLFSSVEQ
jgi:hypothetical protein